MKANKSRPEHAEDQQTVENNGRDAQGRFTAGNDGGPGNPFARRVAELRKVLLETVTDSEMRIVAGQLMVKAKFGDLAAIKLLFQYVLGKPAATVNPDTLDVEEAELYARAPQQVEVGEVLARRVDAEAACRLYNAAVPVLGEIHVRTFRKAMTDPEGFRQERDRLDGLEDDFDDEEEDDADDGVVKEEEAQAAATAPSPNGGTNGNGRPRATRPSPNGTTATAQSQAGPLSNGDDQRRAFGGRGPDRLPPRGT